MPYAKFQEESDVQSFRYDPIGNINFSSTMDDKNTIPYSLTYSSNQSNELINYYSTKSNRLYIWLDNDLYLTEQRFQSLISPNQWKYFATVYECQAFILNQQLQYNPKIYLFSTYSLAEQLFAYEHVSKISAAYLYSNENEIFSKWISSFPMIRGIYSNSDLLFEQFHSDITTNSELLPLYNKQLVCLDNVSFE